MRRRTWAAGLAVCAGGAATAQPVVLSHSNSMDITPTNSVACNCCLPQTTFSNSFWRSFHLPSFQVNVAFEVTSVDVGVELAHGPMSSGRQLIDVSLYLDVNGGAPSILDLVLISTTEFELLDSQEGSIVTIPVSGVVPPGGTLVVEVRGRDHVAASPPPPAHASGGRFFIGSNREGETSPSYIRATSCSLPELTPTQGLVPGLVMHIVMSVTGRAENECYPDCDTSTGRGVLDIFDFLCFQNRFAASSMYACQCDVSTGQNVCDIFDFLCYQNQFAAGCP